MEILKALLELMKDSDTGRKSLELLHGGSIPHWFIVLTRCLVWILLILGVGVILLKLITELQKYWSEAFGRWFTGADEKHFIGNRQRFARFIIAQLEKLNIDESWEDYRFAELEAEVEAEGLQKSSRWIRRLGIRRNNLRRERSLSVALEASDERLILLEGDPGSGKSVALRHLAHRLADRAGKSWNAKTSIPLYLNLKHIRRTQGASIDQGLIRRFALEQLTKVNNRDVERFIDEHFEEGIRNGTWMFLFDSFDEVPDILSSTDDDAIIDQYSTAIYEFFTTFNECKGVVASRYFRSPRQGRLPRFRILPLTEGRRAELIRRAGLKPQVQQAVFGQLTAASESIRQMANNPMFLGLLCEFVRDGSEFPDASHSVFERYIERRLWRDADKLAERFAVTPEEVRSAAEVIAFAMACDDNIGLNPTRSEVLDAIMGLGMSAPESYHELLMALEYIKLARGEDRGVAIEQRRFSFAHRRFQEYFCTCVVLRNSNRVGPVQLLKEPRWRDTAVVLFQTQDPIIIEPLLEEARRQLVEMRALLHPTLLLLPDARLSLREVASMDYSPETVISIVGRRLEKRQNSIVVRDYCWPHGCLHLLGLLQDGLAGRREVEVLELRDLVASIVVSAFVYGRLSDKKVAIENAGLAPSSDLLPMVAWSMYSGSQWLGEAAYTQVTRLEKIPPVVRRWIMESVFVLSVEGRLGRQWQETKAFLLRLAAPRRVLDSARIMMISPLIDLGLWFCSVLMIELALAGVIHCHQVAFITFALLMLESRVLAGVIIRVGGIHRRAGSEAYSMIMLLIRGSLAALALHTGFIGTLPEANQVAGYPREVSAWMTAAIFLSGYWFSWYPVVTVLALNSGASPPFRWSLLHIPLELLFRPRVIVLFFRLMSRAVRDLIETLKGGVSATGRLTVAVVAGALVWGVFDFRTFMYALWGSMLLLSGFSLRLCCADAHVFRKTARIKTLAGIQAMSAWAELHFSVSRLMLIRYVAQRDLIIKNEESRKIVNSLALLLERELDRELEEEGCGGSSGSQEVDAWFTTYVARNKNRLRAWGMPALDELCRLEQRLAENRIEVTSD